MENDLLALWKGVFGDHDGFWELFLRTAFLPDHCRCLHREGRLAAALYWFDVSCRGQKLAYLYAVATHPDFRHQGLCHALMADTEARLAEMGYAGALLVPENPALVSFYGDMGYKSATSVTEFVCRMGAEAASLRAVGPSEYARLRRKFLPEGGVIQEGKSLRFLAEQAEFFAGEDVLLAAYREEETLHCLELLGGRERAPEVLKALGCEKGCFRAPGAEKPFAMFKSLQKNVIPPEYFGFAFD